MSNENKASDFVAGLVIGGFIGAAIALLLAPRPGDETIAQLRERGIELKDRAVDLSSEARKRVSEIEEKSRAVIDEQKERLQTAVKEGKDAAQKTSEDLLHDLEAKQHPAPEEPTA